MSSPHPTFGHRRRYTRSHHDKPSFGICRIQPRHLAPTLGRGAPSSGDLLWTGTLFLPGERSQPGTLDGVCADALHGAEIACAASYLTELIGEVRLSDEPAPTQARAALRTSSQVSSTDSTSPASLPWTWSP